MKDLIDQPQNASFYDNVADLGLPELKELGNKIIKDFKEAVEKLENSSSRNLEFLEEVQQFDANFEIRSAALNVIEDLHPKKSFRDYSSDFVVRISSEYTDLSFNQKLYRKYKEDVDPETLDKEALYLYTKTMRSYKQNGVDKPKAVRDEITKIKKEMSSLATKFSKNIADKTPTLKFEREELDGCFKEFIESRLEKSGKVKVLLVSNSTLHILHNCRVKSTREKVREASLNYAKDANWKVLPDYLNRAEKVANLAGYKNYAEICTEDKMIENPKKAGEFIQSLIDSTKSRVEAELELIKDFKSKASDNSELTYADIDFYGNQIASKLSNLDEEEVKQYFPYQNVKDSILSAFEEMFNISFVPDPQVKVWSKKVEAFKVKESDRVIGRIYLDMHPRKGKYNHACSIGIVTGIKNLILPQNILLCNFNEPSNKNPGLQSLEEVNTFFHEFGHLVHSILGSQSSSWLALSGTSVQRDFVEAPSQLLEEILMDPKVLKRLTKHVVTGKQIPDDLIETIHKKELVFDKAKLKGIAVARQASLAKQSLDVYITPGITNSKLTQIEQESTKEALSIYGDYYAIYDFGHLIGYFSNYYTYMWSLAIAKDLFTQFNHKNLLDTKVADKYRRTILEPGGSKPAAELVEDFLGRPWNMDAFKAYLKEGEELLKKV